MAVVKARQQDVDLLARRTINGERQWPAKFSLWYFSAVGRLSADMV